MKKVFKILIIIWIVIIVIAGIVGYWQKPERKVSAFATGSCGQFGRPIPIGEVLDGAVDVMDQVFQIYQSQTNNLNLAIENITEIIALTSENKEVCDFGKCQAEVGNQGPTWTISLDTLFWDNWDFSLPGLPPMCSPQECTGQPCPDLFPYVRDLAGEKGFVGLGTLKKTFGVSVGLLADWFKDEVKIVTNDIAKADAGSLLTRVDFLKRKIELAREWLTPYSGFGQRTCVANESDRKLIERGELDPIVIQNCWDILLGSEDGYFWPAQPKECEASFKQVNGEMVLTDQCQSWVDDSCNTDNRKVSWSADINCQIFQDCHQECAVKESIDFECNQCLCQKFGDDDDANLRCRDWVCGGSYLNFTCCQ